MTTEPEQVIAALDQAATRILAPYDGGSVAWRRWGEGPPLVLVHGGSGSWLHWIRNIAFLAAHHTVWAVDLPGFGDSELPPAPVTLEGIAQATLASIGALGLEPALLAGFSFGGAISTRMAVTAPDRFRKLVITGLPFDQGPRVLPAQVERWQDVTDPVELAAIQRRNLGILMIAEPDRIDDLAVEIQLRNVTSSKINSRRFNPLQAMQDSLPQTRLPVVGIAGDRDFFVAGRTTDQQAALAALRPGARFHLVADAGHWVPYEGAAAFNPLLLEVLQAP